MSISQTKHEQILATGMHECASDCPPRLYIGEMGETSEGFNLRPATPDLPSTECRHPSVHPVDPWPDPMIPDLNYLVDRIVNFGMSYREYVYYPPSIKRFIRAAFLCLQGNTCWMCNEPATDRMVMDHDHKTDWCRGTAHDQCNRDYKLQFI